MYGQLGQMMSESDHPTIAGLGGLIQGLDQGVVNIITAVGASIHDLITGPIDIIGTIFSGGYRPISYYGQRSLEAIQNGASYWSIAIPPAANAITFGAYGCGHLFGTWMYNVWNGGSVPLPNDPSVAAGQASCASMLATLLAVSGGASVPVGEAGRPLGPLEDGPGSPDYPTLQNGFNPRLPPGPSNPFFPPVPPPTPPVPPPIPAPSYYPPTFPN
jgi:hypothetical protein